MEKWIRKDLQLINLRNIREIDCEFIGQDYTNPYEVSVYIGEDKLVIGEFKKRPDARKLIDMIDLFLQCTANSVLTVR